MMNYNDTLINKLFKKYDLFYKVDYFEVIWDENIIYLEYFVPQNQIILLLSEKTKSHIVRNGKIYKFYNRPKNLKFGEHYLFDIFPGKRENEYFLFASDFQNNIEFEGFLIKVNFLDINRKFLKLNFLLE